MYEVHSRFTDWMTRVRFPAVAGIFFLFATASRSTVSNGHWGRITLWGIKRQEREANHSLPYSAKVKNAWSYTSIPPQVFMV